MLAWLVMKIRSIETYYYRSTLYTWIHEPQNLYSERHISIASAVLMINRGDSILIPQGNRDKYIGHGYAGLITVITEGDHIVTAWVASKDEVKEWLRER